MAGQPDSRVAQKYILPLLTASQAGLLPLSPDEPRHADILKKLKASFAISMQDFGCEIRLREALADIWLDLLGLLPEDSGRKTGSSEKIKRMLLYIHGHYAERLKISDIAAAGYVSERECYRIFQSFLHTAPAEYVRQYRLQKACGMLAEGNDTVTQISLACGFGSSSFFGKVFLADMGMTPTAYRRSRQCGRSEQSEQLWQDTSK